MNVLNLENVKKSYGERTVFENLNLGIQDHDKIGIVGINGTGKSTLLKIIAGIEEEDKGTIIKANHVTIAYLPQNPEFSSQDTILQYVCENKSSVVDEWTLESEAKMILNQLGIIDFNQNIHTLSGGQRKRVALARTILQPADILILDEPTNHLDNEMVEWLENYLHNFKGALLMVTHDRYFLDSVTNHIIEIAQNQLFRYETNYSGYIELKCQREEMQTATEEKRKNLLRNELKWVQRGARARSTKQKARLERFEELSSIGNLERVKNIQLESTASRLGKKTIEIENISIQFGTKQIISHFSYNLIRNERIGIIGSNGCGKSTLLNIIAGRILPDSGSVIAGETIRIGYFTQENEAMNLNERVIDYIKNIAEYLTVPSGTISASQMLERFLFTPQMQYTPIGKLSGGEKRRLYLLKILMEAPNVLVLDEPTNDLDITTLEVLEDYLDRFQGIVIVVSHDRYFLDRIVDRIFAFDGQANIMQYEGGYSDYREKCPLVDRVITQEVKKAPSTKTERVRTEKLKFSYNEQREFESIDATIEKLEIELEILEKSIEEKASQYSELNKLLTKKELLQNELEEKMERWVYLNDLSEKIQAQAKEV